MASNGILQNTKVEQKWSPKETSCRSSKSYYKSSRKITSNCWSRAEIETTTTAVATQNNNNKCSKLVRHIGRRRCKSAILPQPPPAGPPRQNTRRTRHRWNQQQNSFPSTILLLFFLGIFLSSSISDSDGFVLDGTQNSFAQFRKWYTGINGTLELEFKTEQPNGLVLYTDDGGTYDFFELKLVEGALRLRYNLGGGAQIITVGHDLHDGNWHKVQVRIILIWSLNVKSEFKRKIYNKIGYLHGKTKTLKKYLTKSQWVT